MNKEQFDRMSDFALRMVEVCSLKGRWRKELTGHVREILAELSQEIYGFHYSRIKSWDEPEEADGQSPQSLCDFMDDYCLEEGLEKIKEYRNGNTDLVQTKVGCALMCCIRAGCDVATNSQVGVLGYSVADLRAMWTPEKIPDWVCQIGRAHV